MAAAKPRRAAKPRAAAVAAKSDDPLSWLYLNPLKTLEHVQFGVLRKHYAERTNSAVEFGRFKLQPVAPGSGDEAAITAERVDVILPIGADDGLADPHALLAAMDQTAVQSALLIYVTIAFPEVTRLHEAWESARAFACLVARERQVSSVVVLHAPCRVGSANPVHAHLLIAPRRIGQLGALALGPYDEDLCRDRGQALIEALWERHLAEWRA